MLLLLLIDKIVLPFIVVLPVLIATAYFTLAERKVLASVQSINKINKTKIFIRVNIWKCFTKKPMLSRMGKGAGVITNWFALIRPGFILFEILSLETNFVIYKIIKRAIVSFPFKLMLIKKTLK